MIEKKKQMHEKINIENYSLEFVNYKKLWVELRIIKIIEVPNALKKLKDALSSTLRKLNENIWEENFIWKIKLFIVQCVKFNQPIVLNFVWPNVYSPEQTKKVQWYPPTMDSNVKAKMTESLKKKTWLHWVFFCPNSCTYSQTN